MGNNQSNSEPQQPQQPAKTGYGYDAQAISSKPVANNEVKLAVSPIGGIPTLTAYHSSVIVNGEEYSFSDGGITCASGTASHDAMNRQGNSSTQVAIKTEVFDMGMSQYNGRQLRAALERHFVQGTYDLLKKNCNSFSDCALFYLLKKRMDGRYRQLDSIGARNPGLVSQLSGSGYTPNAKVQNFDLEQLIKDIDPDKVWDMKGETTGGVVADSREAMRAARLARLGGGGAAASSAAASSAPPSGQGL